MLDDRRVQHHEELGADTGEDGHPFALDGADRGVGVEARVHDRRCIRAPPVSRATVHSPNPNGAGNALRNTSSAVKSPATAASWWKNIHRFCVVHHALGHPGGARRGVHEEEVVGAQRAGGQGAGVEAPCLRLALALGGDDHAGREREVVGHAWTRRPPG